MTEYHKINAPFKRDMEAPGKPLIIGDWAVPELGYLADNMWEFTEKVDGTNIRIVIKRSDDFVTITAFGRTDNADIPPHLKAHLDEAFGDITAVGGSLWGHLQAMDLRNTSSTIVLYGEGYGPKIQGGGKYRTDASFVLFDVNVDGWWLNRKDVDDVAFKLGVDAVPTLGYGTLYDAVAIVKRGTLLRGGEFKQFGTSKIEGLKSAWGDFEAEGIVARPVVPLFDRKGNRIITKIKARDFK